MNTIFTIEVGKDLAQSIVENFENKEISFNDKSYYIKGIDYTHHLKTDLFTMNLYCVDEPIKMTLDTKHTDK